MSTQEKTLRSMTDRLKAFCPGTFWVAKPGESDKPALCTERCIYPIKYMSLSIADQAGATLFHDTGLPPECRLLLDDHGEEPAFARMALFRGGNDIIAVSGDASPIRGSVLIIADSGGIEQHVFAISALFDVEDGRQVSSILWDTSSVLITHWMLQNKLLRKEGIRYAPEQYQPQSASARSNETNNMLQYFQKA